VVPGRSRTIPIATPSGDLKDITVRSFVIWATHDTMDPGHVKWMAEQSPRGRYRHCPEVRDVGGQL
jgi:proline iminopeptidase